MTTDTRTTDTPQLDEAKLEAFVGKVVGDMSAAESAVVAYLGDRLGLYRAMAHAGPLTATDVASSTGLDERYVTEWLSNQYAGGYVEYDADAATFELPAEHAAVLADENSSPVFMAGILDIIAAMWAAAPQLEAAFRSGDGVGWHEHDPRLFDGVERLFAPIYRSQLVEQWIPVLDGVEDKLRRGAHVADVGCGHGASIIAMAKAFPQSRFHGLDYHESSIVTARERAEAAGVADRVTFDVADASDLPRNGYDLICFFDCLHDTGDPGGIAQSARQALDADGTVMLVEPMAGDDLEDNQNPVSRLYYAGSVFLCTPSALSQQPEPALGAQVGARRWEHLLGEAGFSRFRTVTETPFNLVLEARS